MNKFHRDLLDLLSKADNNKVDVINQTRDQAKRANSTVYLYSARCPGKSIVEKLLKENVVEKLKGAGLTLSINGAVVDDFAEETSKKVAIIGGRGQMKPVQMVSNPDGSMSKPAMIKALRRALEASGHTKERAKQLAKEHYKKYLGQQRGW